MPNVTVNPIQTVKVRVDQNSPKIIHNTTTFVGATDVQAQINQIYDIANNAIETANAAVQFANNKLDLSGGTINGELIVTGNVTTHNNFIGIVATIDGGLFT